MRQLDTDPYFAPEAQESFVVGDRVYAVEDGYSSKEGGEGVYLGRLGSNAIVGWDTPSGKPYQSEEQFKTIRNLYR